jgi:hypothetical protein
MYRIVELATDRTVEIGKYSELVDIYFGEILGGIYEIEVII